MENKMATSDKQQSNLEPPSDTAKKEEQTSIPSENIYLPLPALAGDVANANNYYIIEVLQGIGYRQCYLGTQTMAMLFDPVITQGNLAAQWKFYGANDAYKIVNFITEQSPDPTKMQLGAQISSNPDTYSVILLGNGQTFHFISDNPGSTEHNIYVHTTEGDPDSPKAFLQPRASGDIVAVVMEQPPRQYLFRIHIA